MGPAMKTERIAVIEPKPARRAVATGMIGLLGTILVYVAITTPPANPLWLAFLLAMGAGILFLSWRLWEATGITIELTREELREVGGRLIARVEDIDSVDRGFFAFKPANGFLLRLKSPGDKVYAPGLWWRFGRRVMVGGVPAGAQTKSTADLITILLVERDRG